MKAISPVLTEKVKSRFLSHVKIGTAQDCWEWAGHKDYQGYGIVKVRPKLYRAPRMAWVIANGTEIPDGMMVCHTCDNPSCVNPHHLFLGLNEENVKDKVAKGRQSRAGKGSPGESHPRAILKESQVLEIRKRYLPHRITAKMLASEYGVSEREIRSIVYCENWKHLQGANDANS